MHLSDKVESVGSLYRQCFANFKHLWCKLLPIFVIQWICYGIIVGSFLLAGFTSMHVDIGGSGLLIGLMLLIFSLVVFAYFKIVIFNRTDGILHGDEQKARHAWQAGKSRLWPTIGFIILVYLIYGGLAIAGALLSATLFAVAGGTVGSIVSFIFYALIVFFLVRIMYGFPLVASRQSPVFSAISKSLALSRGYFWCLIGMILLTTVVPNAIVGGISYLLVTFIAQNAFVSIFSVLLFIICNFVTTVLLIGGIYTLLHDSELKHKNG